MWGWGLFEKLVDEVAPFYVLLDKELRIASHGKSVQKILGEPIKGLHFGQYFFVKRPIFQFELSFENICSRQNQVFLLHFRKDGAPPMRGQFLQFHNGLLFIGSPYLHQMEDLKKHGLTIHDFALADPTIDLLFLHEMERNGHQELMDTTEKLKVANKELEEANLQLNKLYSFLDYKYKIKTKDYENLDDTLKEFTYSVSHDLKAPIRQMSMFSQILLDRMEQLKIEDSKVRSFSNFIVESSNRAVSMIDGLYSITQATSRAIKYEKVNLPDLVHRLVAAMPQAKTCAFDFRFEIGAIRVNTDEVLAEIVLGNLISNAVKYSQQAAEPMVQISTKLVEGQLLICIKDNGIGFEQKHADSIFRLFGRLHPDEKSYGGVGVGLSNVKKAVQRLNGSISVTSSPGNGATFLVQLPQ